MGSLAVVDPEVAAATFEQHLDTYWASGRPDALGLRRFDLDPLRSVVAIPAMRNNGMIDEYFVMLDARHYDLDPPVVTFVQPPPPPGETDGHTWPDATPGTRWWPTWSTSPGWFALHHSYGLEDGTTGQLVCCSVSARYYISGHNPTESQRWRQGRHTVTATISRIHEALQQPYYSQPAGV